MTPLAETNVAWQFDVRFPAINPGWQGTAWGRNQSFNAPNAVPRKATGSSVEIA